MLRNVSSLASGVLLAQAIALVSLPLLTRLYGPEGFAALALFLAFVGSLSPGICARYEIAQVVVKSRRERDILFVLAVWSAWVVNLALIIVLVLFWRSITAFFNAESLGATALVFPLGLALFGTVMALRFYANSQKRYGIIGQMSVAQALSTALAAVVLALVAGGGDWLIQATVLGYVLSSGYMILMMRRNLARIQLVPTRLHLRIASKYRHFPIYNATSSVLDGITLSMPVFFLTRDYPEAVVGYYALLVRVAAAPIGFIATAVAQVHLRRTAEMVHRAEPALRYLMRTTALLGGVIAAPAVLFIAAAPAIFAWAFGAEWREAGELLQILMPALAVKLVVSALSGVFSGTGNNKLGAAWKIGAFVVTLGAFYLYSGSLEVKEIFLLMAVVDLFLYAAHYSLIVYVVRYPKKVR